MHMTAVVALPPGTTDIDAGVTQALAPYDENAGEWDEEAGTFTDTRWWDWWVIGGRWDNAIIPGNVARLGDVRDGLSAYTVVGAERFAHCETCVDDPTAEYGYRVVDTSADVAALLDSLSDDCVVVLVDYHR